MAIGFRIHTKVERTPARTVKLFEGLPVANIADAMGRIYALDQGIRPYNNVPLLGTAFTVKVPGGDNLLLHKAIELAQEGDVIAVNGLGDMARALCGGLMMETAREKGIRGFVLDGCIRDRADAEKFTNFSCYARGVQPNGPYKNGPGEMNYPIAVGQQVIFPGDVIVGDEDGLIVIPKADAAEVAAAARKIMESETVKMQNYAEGKVNREWLYKALEQSSCEVLD